MVITKEMCSEMMFNPMVPNAEGNKIFKIYPQLEWLKTVDAVFECEPYGGVDKVVRYILFMYDAKTPLKKINNYKSRKRNAMMLAGYEFDGDLPKESSRKKVKDGEKIPMGYKHMNPIQMMMAGKSPIVNRMIVLYVRMFKSHKFALLSGLEESFFRNVENMYSGDNAAKEDKEALIFVEKSQKAISDLYEDIYHAKVDNELISETMSVIFEESLGLNPESMAERLSEGKYVSPL